MGRASTPRISASGSITELRRNVLLSGWFGYLRQDYEAYPRLDQKYTCGTAIKYLVNRYVTTGLEYRYIDYGSSFNGINGVENYTRNIVLGTLTLSY